MKTIKIILTFSSVVFSIVTLIAQQQITNNGTIKIHPGTQITFFGNFANNNTLTDSGQMVFFSGTSLQNISGSSAITFNNLTISNSGAGVSLSGTTNVTASNSLVLTSGVVTTGLNTLILSNNAAANLSYTSGFINGTFRRYITPNTSTYLFPVGIGTAASGRHRISYINNSLIGPSYLDASVTSFVQVPPNTDASLSTSQSGTQINSTTGAAAGESIVWAITADAARTGGDYGVQLFAENSTLSAADDNTFCPLKRDATSITYADFLTYESTTSIPASGTAGRIYSSGNGYAQRTGYTSFSNHIIGIETGITPLPIELLTFDARPVENAVDVTWSTATEFNSDYFMIQCSKDGALFKDVMQKEAAGNSSTTQNYSSTDYDPCSNIAYYRLKQVDNDGKFTFSYIVEVKINTDDIMSVYPNPSDHEKPFYVSISGQNEEKILLVVNDIQGKIFYSRIIQISSDMEVIIINPEEKLKPGLYFVAVTSNSINIKRKIILE